jgi:hypothetical protein
VPKFDVKALKKSFFDTKAVRGKVDPAVRKAFSKYGAFVRTRSKQSIKRGKGTSRVGSPPIAHTGAIKFILFSYDEEAKSVVIGPVLGGSASGAPKNLEHGGTAIINHKQTRIAARPFMQPAADYELNNLRNDLKGMIR